MAGSERRASTQDATAAVRTVRAVTKVAESIRVYLANSLTPFIQATSRACSRTRSEGRARQPNQPRLGSPEQLEITKQLQILQQLQVSHDGGVRGAVLIDTRGRKPRIYASSCNPLFGVKILRSDDIMGRRWRPFTCPQR